MLRFFNKIRYKLASENRVAKYLRYAVGEILLVVIGILIALQVNNWNEERKTQNQKSLLINTLATDFETTLNITNERIVFTENIIAKVNLLLQIVSENNQNISVDSLKILADYGWVQITFLPALSSYNTATSTGNIGLLQSLTLSDAFLEFDRAYTKYLKHYDLSGEIVYIGSLWDLRRSLGSTKVLRADNAFSRFPYNIPSDFLLSDQEYRQIFRKKEVFAAYENINWIYNQMLQSFIDVKLSTEKIIAELNRLNDK